MTKKELAEKMKEFIALQPSNDKDDWYVTSQGAAESVLASFAEFLGFSLETVPTIEPVQEPVAYIHKWKPHASTIGQSLFWRRTSPHGDDVEIIPLYTHPPQREPLTEATLTFERDSRAMFLARLENGDKWLTAEDVLALLNDCDMLAARGIGEAR